MKKISKYLILIPFFCLFASCTDEQDFSQIDDLTITPTVEGSILFVETPESLINLVTTGDDFVSRDFNFDAFAEGFFAENVLSGIIVYEVENTTSKPLQLIGELLDVNGNVLDQEVFDVEPGPTAVVQREIAYGGPTGRSIDIIRNTSSIRISARNLGDTTSVSNLPDPKLIFRSSGKFTVEIL